MKLAYEVFDPVDKVVNEAPVVLLHCAFDSRKAWLEVAPIFANITGRKVFILDARNHGDSPWSEDMSWSLLLEDLEEFLDEHKIRKVVLVGHGMGGKIACTFALKKPERVQLVVSDNISPGFFLTNEEENIIRMEKLMKESLKAIPHHADESVAKKIVLEFIRKKRDDHARPTTLFDANTLPIKRQGTGFVWRTNVNVVTNFLTNGKINEISELGVYRGDTLFLYGPESPTQMRKDPLIRKLFPRAVVMSFEKMTHLIRQECPEKYGTVISYFIKGYLPPLAKY